MSKQLPVPPKRGRGRPPKVREPEPEPESETEQNHNLEDNETTFINSRFAIPNKDKTFPSAPAPVPIQEPIDDMTEILQQIQDSELAMAMDESIATYTANTHVNMDYGVATNNLIAAENDDDLADILRQIKEQEERDLRDAELARQLAAEDNPQPQGAEQGDDMDDVLEQIRQMESQEQLKKKGNAFAKPLSLDRLMAQQDKEDTELRMQAQREIENNNWRAERARQDREFQRVLKQDQEKERMKRRLQQLPSQLPHQQQQSENDNSSEYTDGEHTDGEHTDGDEEPIPQTKEEIRAARLKFFSKISK